MEETTLEDLSIACLMEVYESKMEELSSLTEQISECLCAPCPPGEPGEVIAGVEGGVQVTAGDEGTNAGAITVGGNIVKGAVKTLLPAKEVAEIAARKRGES